MQIQAPLLQLLDSADIPLLHGSQPFWGFLLSLCPGGGLGHRVQMCHCVWIVANGSSNSFVGASSPQWGSGGFC